MVTIISFLSFLVVFLGVGILSATRKSANTVDYLLAGRRVSPWLTALSAVSTNNSGFMFVGLIGATYNDGLSAMWLMVGWISGDYLAWRWVFRRLRERSEQLDVASIPSFLGTQIGRSLAGSDGLREDSANLPAIDSTPTLPSAKPRQDPVQVESDLQTSQQRPVVVLAALVALVFLGTYAAAQLTAGSKALHVLFGWNYLAGTLIGAGIVAAYCFAGGIRASIWTDAAQSVAMLASMLLLLTVAVHAIGGLGPLWSQLRATDESLVDWRPKDLRFGFGIYLVGWVVAGVGVLGQPHVMIRAMAIDSAAGITRARRIYFAWYIAFASAAIFVGLCCRVLLPASETFDSELALPRLSQQLLPGVLVGFILAGLFAATISTADSQILSCSAAVTQDLFPHWGESYARTKAGTLIITVAVVGIVLLGNQSVFQLVVLSWSALASGLGPLLAVRSLGRPVTSSLGVAMILAGLATVLVWRYVLVLSGALYEVLPGMAAGFLVYFLWQRSR